VWAATTYAVAAACEHATMGKYVGWFAPEYKFIAEAYREISVILANVKSSSSKDKVFTTLGAREWGAEFAKGGALVARVPLRIGDVRERQIR
jgi:hypothetical protein